MTVVTIATTIAVIVDTIGIATATEVMTEIVTVPIRPEIIVIAVPTFKNAQGSSEIRAPRLTLFSRLTPHGFQEGALTNQL